MLLLCNLPAGATPVPSPSDTLTACHTVPTTALPVCSAVTATEGAENKVFTFNANIGDPGEVFEPTLLLEPNGSISDIFGVTAVPAEDGLSFELFFISDPGPSFITPFLGDSTADVACEFLTCLQEGPSGGPFSMNSYLSSAAKGSWSATFSSDGDGIATGGGDPPVPEPASASVVLGLAALGLCAWKKKRAA
jgi:hypothetical protein